MGVYGISARNVREALPRAVNLLLRKGEELDDLYSFNEGPVAITFRHPKQHVLVTPYRDANPFYYLVEGLAMLASRRDEKLSKLYTGNVSHPAGHCSIERSSLVEVVTLLRDEPDTDRAVLSLWDDADDRPRPYNLSAVFRVVDDALDMTIFSRATDVLFGICGGDAVRFPLLLEYVAAMAKLPMGRYTQVANDFRMGLKPWRTIARRAALIGAEDAGPLEMEAEDYGATLSLVDNAASFDADLRTLWMMLDRLHDERRIHEAFAVGNRFLVSAYFMAAAFELYRRRHFDKAFAMLAEKVEAPDWRRAGEDWLERRLSALAAT